MDNLLKLSIMCFLMIGILNATTLTHINSNIEGVFLSSIAFGDYNRSGNMDLVVSGSTPQGNITKVYNNSNGVFSFTDLSIPGISSSSVSWIDYDNDNDLDLFITGRINSQQMISKLYRNDGVGLIATDFLFSPMTNASSAWGDINNDGRADLLLTGTISDTQCATKLYMNHPQGFTESDLELPSVHSGSVKFGDYNNDGWVDILLTGISQDGTRISKVLRNDQVTFTDINAPLLAVGNSSVAWGDYDNDGLLDIALSGRANTNEIVTKVYRNTGGSFVDANASIMGVYISSLAWADIDNNGYIDLVISGGRSLTAPFNPYSAVYYNSDGSFTSSQSLSGLCFSSIGICDIDSDGDLDILLTGRSSGGTGSSLLYSNTGTPQNTIPSAPINLQVHEYPDNFRFTWDESEDSQQNSTSLSYSIRIGSSPGACDIVSSSSLSDGQGLLPDFGRVHSVTGFSIKRDAFHPKTTYYWSCQSVDNSFAKSLFAQESTFNTSVESSDLMENSAPLMFVTPNPFHSSVTIDCSIIKNSRVIITVYNTRGQKIATLLDCNKERGRYSVVWAGVDMNERSVAPGVYFIRLDTDDDSIVSKAILLK